MTFPATIESFESYLIKGVCRIVYYFSSLKQSVLRRVKEISAELKSRERNLENKVEISTPPTTEYHFRCLPTGVIDTVESEEEDTAEGDKNQPEVPRGHYRIPESGDVPDF